MKEKEVQAIKEIERRLQESATLEACLVNEGIAVNDNMGVMESSGIKSENSSSETSFSRSVDENRSFDIESSSSEGNHADVDIGSSNDKDNVNTGKHGLGFENQNDYVNPSLLNKVKELAPCLYNINEMGKDELSDHKIISEEELKCEAEKRLKVKQRKSPVTYHGFVYAETQFEEPPKVPLKK
ncbi:hypothetical protein Tco_1564406 [Tanacetum coccineum]